MRLRGMEMTNKKTTEDMHRELINAGWVHCGGTTYSAEDGSFWRGPFGAWEEMKRRIEPGVAIDEQRECRVCGGLGSIEDEDGVWICPCNKSVQNA